MSEQNMDELASLNPLYIVEDYVVELVDRPLQSRVRDIHRNSSYKRQPGQAADDL